MEQALGQKEKELGEARNEQMSIMHKTKSD